jgi:tetratricopeptide (TPR) repeat protein
MWRLLFVLLMLFPGMRARYRSAEPGDMRRRDIIECSPGSSAELLPDADGRYAPVFPGWGHYHYAISTSSDSAQFYFDQGLSLYYSYHLTESLASFKEASLMDSACAMVYWGQALAMGPYYNSTYTYKMPAVVLPVLEKMNGLAGRAGVKERELLSVMNRRYSTDLADSRRNELNHDYSTGMMELIGKYPDDKDIKALYVDGVMSEHAWDMFDPKGVARPWTPELVQYCEAILAADAYHPAALHYQIHLLEASLHPEATLASADKLHVLMPGVAHMVHMSSHTYQRTGLYGKGVAINDSASEAQRNFDRLAPNLHLGSAVIHFHAVEAFCALNGGMYEKARQAAEECRKIAAPRMQHSDTYLQYLYMMPVFVEIRMGKWQSILDRPGPERSWTYAALLNDFARGLAFVRTGDLPAARLCLDSMRERINDPVLEVRMRPHNSPKSGAVVAMTLLSAEILFAEGKQTHAMETFETAMGLEDGMSYGEPKDWVLPVRHFAGAVLLKSKHPEDAEKMYREDLVHNPGNGWALIGLARCLEMQNKKGAAEYRARAREAFAGAEELPTGSVY